MVRVSVRIRATRFSPVVPPTPVIQGLEAGKVGTKVPIAHPTPLSPEAARSEMPRTPAAWNSGGYKREGGT